MNFPPPPPQSPPSSSSLFHLPLHASGNSFPVIAIALIGIVATAFLLVGYYVFVIKCCLNWHRIDVLNRFSARRRTDDDFSSDGGSADAAAAPKGLDEAIIRSIPVIKFRKLADHEERENNNNNNNNMNNGGNSKSDANSYECAVCLSEFEDGEKLRVIPNCCHAFHIDCIDIWLQNNANCPLCRSGISPSSILHNNDRIFLHPPPPQNPPPATTDGDNFTGDEDDYVVIEIQGNNLDEPRLVSKNGGGRKKGRKLSMGDEWIDMREKDEEFQNVLPIRRSISMDLSVDREFSVEIQQCCCSSSSNINSSSNSGNTSNNTSKVRRSIFSFGYGRSSRGSVQPLHLDP